MGQWRKLDGPTLQEQQTEAPDVATHRSRKDRRRWCRGKRGVAHVTEVRLDSWGVYRCTVNPQAETCHWWSCGAWQGLGADKHYVPREWSWSCAHIEVCVHCGKHLRRLIGTQCPDWRPRSG